MNDAHPKSWWQTLGGLLTGIAALITAITGSIVALRQSDHLEDRGEKAIAASQQLAASIMPRSSESIGAAPTAEPRPISTLNHQTPIEAIAPAIDRKPYSVELPARREYALGTARTQARYRVLAANVVPKTPESDVLAIKVRVTSEGEYPSAFGSSQFTLRIDEKSLKPENHFTDRIPVGETREREARFSLPPGQNDAVFRIDVFPDFNAEIPLDLAPPN